MIRARNTILGLLVFAAASCAGGGGAASAPAQRMQRSLLLPRKGTVTALAFAPDLGWHRGGIYAFVDAPGNRTVVYFSSDGAEWERYALFDRAGQVYGAAFWNPVDGYILHGNQDSAILYKTNFALGKRELIPIAKYPGRLVRMLDGGARAGIVASHEADGAPANLVFLGADAIGRGVVLRLAERASAGPGGETKDFVSAGEFEGAAPAFVAGYARHGNKTFVTGGSGGRGALYVAEGEGPFRRLPLDEIPNLVAIDFDASGRGIAVGARGEILCTSDGGERWTASLAGTEADLSSICIVEGGAAFACGRLGTVLFTSDFGANWRTVSLGVRDELIGLVRSPERDGVHVLGMQGSVPFLAR